MSDDWTASFQYSELVLASLAPLQLVLVAFGGRLFINIAGIGLGLAYIFDVIGIVEITILLLILVALGLWGSLVYAGRLLLMESFAYFAVIIAMGIVIFYSYIIVLSRFKTVLHEFDSLFYWFETLIFTTTPLLASIILTWFLCVEIPVIDMSYCFCIVYFVYMYIFAHPRKSSHPDLRNIVGTVKAEVDGSNGSSVMPFVIPLDILSHMYAVPVVMSPLIHTSIHWNTLLYVGLSDLLSLLTSLLVPIVLMLYVADKQTPYYNRSNDNSWQKYISTAKTVASAALLICLQDHPIFDDIKSFSGLPTNIASAIICSIGLLLYFTLYFHRKSHATYKPSELLFMENMKREVGISNIFVTVCLCLASVLGGIIINASFVTLLNCGVWAIAISQLYQLDSSSGILIPLALASLAAASAAVVGMSFTWNTLMFLNIKFEWIYDTTLTIQTFCLVFGVLIAIATLAPLLVLGNKLKKIKVSRSKEDLTNVTKSYGYLPSAYDSTPAAGAGGVVSSHSYALDMFAACLQILSFVFAAEELMIREQEWDRHRVSVNVVYPGYLLLVSAGILVATAAHLYRHEYISTSNLLSVIVVQSSKLLHLGGFPALACASCASLILNYTIPFAACFNSITDITTPGEANDVHRNVTSYLPRNLQVLFYVVSAAGSTYWAYNEVSHELYSLFIDPNPSALQRGLLCISLWCGLVAAILLIYYRKLSLIRSIFAIIAVVAALFSVDSSLVIFALYKAPSAEDIALGNSIRIEHNGVYVILSLLLLLAVGLKVLKIRNVFSRLLFIISFSYCAGRTLLSVGFPLTLNNNALHDTLSLPWSYSLSSAILASSSVIHAMSAPATSSAMSTGWMYSLLCILPIVALIYSFVFDCLYAYSSGIIWIAALANALVCVFTSETLCMLNGLVPTISISLTCFMAAIVTIIWTVLGSLGHAHAYADITIPLALFTLCLTKTGVIMEGKHPVYATLTLSTLWWVVSGIISVFLKGYFQSADVFTFLHPVSDTSYFSDGNVSLWTAESVWYPLSTIALILIPLPAIYIPITMTKQEYSVDMLFMISVISAFSIVGANINSVRLLGITGTALAGWKCYQMDSLKVKSERLI